MHIEGVVMTECNKAKKTGNLDTSIHICIHVYKSHTLMVYNNEQRMHADGGGGCAFDHASGGVPSSDAQREQSRCQVSDGSPGEPEFWLPCSLPLRSFAMCLNDTLVV